jgi:hypothetical protein
VLIKLIQGGLLDVATSVDKLDFSRLNGYDSWELSTVGNGSGDCLACVTWQPADRYLLQVEETIIRIPRHDLIIPTLISELKRLEGLPGPPPTIFILAGCNS